MNDFELRQSPKNKITVNVSMLPFFSQTSPGTLSHYEWPGNVRELQNTIQRFLATDQIGLPGGRSLSAEKEDGAQWHVDGLNVALEELECRIIQESLRKTLWNRGAAADFLKISRWTLQRKMQKYAIGKKEEQA